MTKCLCSSSSHENETTVSYSQFLIAPSSTDYGLKPVTWQVLLGHVGHWASAAVSPSSNSSCDSRICQTSFPWPLTFLHLFFGLKCPYSVFPAVKDSAHPSCFTSCWLFHKSLSYIIQFSSLFSVFPIPFFKKYHTFKNKIYYCIISSAVVCFLNGLQGPWIQELCIFTSGLLCSTGHRAPFNKCLLNTWMNLALYIILYHAFLMKWCITWEPWLLNSVLKCFQDILHIWGKYNFIIHVLDISWTTGSK